MTGHKLTVVVPSFNREELIGDAIESVLNSTFTDFELLVVDDASTDGTARVATEYANADERVRVVVNRENLGDYGNRNRALQMVETPFLKYHDSDDLLYPYGLEVMMRLLEGEPRAGFALSAGWAWPGGPCPMLLTPRMAYQREYLGDGLFYCGPAGALFRTPVLKSLGGFPERGVASDFCFWLQACAVTNLLLVPADLFWYRIHPDQEFQADRAQGEYAVAHGEAWRALFAPECPLEGDELARARRNYAFRLLRSSWRDVRARRWSSIPIRLRSAGITWRDWLRYPPRRAREPLAGTPLDAKGNFVVPDWLRLPSMARDERD